MPALLYCSGDYDDFHLLCTIHVRITSACSLLLQPSRPKTLLLRQVRRRGGGRRERRRPGVTALIPLSIPIQQQFERQRGRAIRDHVVVLFVTSGTVCLQTLWSVWHKTLITPPAGQHADVSASLCARHRQTPLLRPSCQLSRNWAKEQTLCLSSLRMCFHSSTYRQKAFVHACVCTVNDCQSMLSPGRRPTLFAASSLIHLGTGAIRFKWPPPPLARLHLLRLVNCCAVLWKLSHLHPLALRRPENSFFFFAFCWQIISSFQGKRITSLSVPPWKWSIWILCFVVLADLFCRQLPSSKLNFHEVQVSEKCFVLCYFDLIWSTWKISCLTGTYSSSGTSHLLVSHKKRWALEGWWCSTFLWSEQQTQTPNFGNTVCDETFSPASWSVTCWLVLQAYNWTVWNPLYSPQGDFFKVDIKTKHIVYWSSRLKCVRLIHSSIKKNESASSFVIK